MIAPQAEATSASERTPAQPPAAPLVTFAAVYEAHFAFVWRCALRLGAPMAAVDDLVQETFIVVHRRLPDFEGRSSLRTWLFGIVANVVRAHRRTALARQPQELSAGEPVEVDRVADTAEGPFEIATKTEAAHVVNRLLDELDDEKREVFILAELEQMTAPEIALAVGLPLNTVYSRLRLGRESFAAAAARHRARDGWRVR